MRDNAKTGMGIGLEADLCMDYPVDKLNEEASWEQGIWKVFPTSIDHKACAEDMKLASVTANSCPYINARKQFKPEKARDQVGVTLATILSQDRMDRLETLMRRWMGPIVAVIVQQEQQNQSAQKYQWLHSLRSACKDCDGDLIIVDFPTGTSMHAFPINTVRNTALQAAMTEYVIFCDVDLVPDVHLYSALKELTADSRNRSKRKAFVVPTFWLGPGVQSLPGSKLDLIKLEKDGLAKPIFYYPKLKNDTEVINVKIHFLMSEFHAWHTESTNLSHRTIQAKYNWEAEPYLVVNIADPCYPGFAPEFEKFGYDKQEHVHHLQALGYTFHVLTDHFLAHVWHPKANWAGEARQQSMHELQRLMVCKRIQRENKREYRQAVERTCRCPAREYGPILLYGESFKMQRKADFIYTGNVYDGDLPLPQSWLDDRKSVQSSRRGGE